MMHPTVRICLFATLSLFSLSAYGSRRVVTAPCVNSYMYVLLTNPSSVAQTVSVRFAGTGVLTPFVAGNALGHEATECASGVCTNKASFSVIPPNGNLAISVGITNGSTNVGSTVGVTATISVTEDSGHLLGNTICQHGGNLAYVGINAGRAF